MRNIFLMLFHIYIYIINMLKWVDRFVVRI